VPHCWNVVVFPRATAVLNDTGGGTGGGTVVVKRFVHLSLLLIHIAVVATDTYTSRRRFRRLLPSAAAIAL
jgi:hypothetical protein